jgi:hypothetical protein
MTRLLDSDATAARDQYAVVAIDIGVTIRNVVSELEAVFERRGIAINVDEETDLCHT